MLLTLRSLTEIVYATDAGDPLVANVASSPAGAAGVPVTVSGTLAVVIAAEPTGFATAPTIGDAVGTGATSTTVPAGGYAGDKPNTSASGNTLSPVLDTPPEYDLDLDLIFQTLVARITRLPGSLVRPRWQPTVGKVPTPDPGTDWCAIGITTIDPDANPYIEHFGDGLGSDEYVRHEQIALFATFYGAHAAHYAMLLRDGLAVPQNSENLLGYGIRVVSCDRARSAPELYNQQWVRRYDMGVTFRRKVARTYRILNIIDAPVELISDDIGIIGA